MRVRDEKLGVALNIPFTCSEITWKQHCESLGVESRYIVKDEETGETEIPAESVAEFYLEYNATLIKGDVHKVPHRLTEDIGRNLVGEMYIIQPGDEISQERLYAHLVTVVESYEGTHKVKYEQGWRPSEYRVKIGKEMFYIETSRARRLFKDESYTTGEVVEVKEFRRKLGQQIEETGDREGQLAFNLGASVLAILLRKRGENLPYRKEEREKFINRRAKLFSELPLSVHRDCCFFLTTTLQDLAPLILTGGFFPMVQSQQQQAK